MPMTLQGTLVTDTSAACVDYTSGPTGLCVIAGSTVDVPMRYRGTVKQPELEFWVAKWMVPDNAPTGIIRYSVTAKDKKGRTGEFKPFRQDLSELTVVE